MDRKMVLLLGLIVCCLVACGPSDEQCAEQRIETARHMVDQHQWQLAQRQLDSISVLYPKQVAARRCAKALSDSIHMLEAIQTRYYSDSVLTLLLPKSDSLLKFFRYEHNKDYEDHGKYVHRLLVTQSNTTRCFLQAYVRDDHVTQVKGYYFGSHPIHMQSLLLCSDDMEARFTGSNHAFEVEGWHEILTLPDSTALGLLHFIASHRYDRIRVQGEGATIANGFTYYLQDNEKQALTDTYQLGILMYDIQRLEESIKKASLFIDFYYRKYQNSQTPPKNDKK